MPFSLLGSCQVRAACPLATLPAETEWCLSATSRVSHSAGDTEWAQANRDTQQKEIQPWQWSLNRFLTRLQSQTLKNLGTPQLVNCAAACITSSLSLQQQGLFWTPL